LQSAIFWSNRKWWKEWATTGVNTYERPGFGSWIMRTEFAAGMSGGVAYVFDERLDFTEKRCNRQSVGSGAGD